jgi:hypothetical protein
MNYAYRVSIAQVAIYKRPMNYAYRVSIAQVVNCILDS